MDIAVFDVSLLDTQRDTDNLASVDPNVWIIYLLQEKEFRYLSYPRHGTPTEYPLYYGHLNSPLSVCTLPPYSPNLPCLDHSSPGSSQGYSEYDVQPQTPPAQVQHQSTLVIRQYSPNGRPAVMRDDSDQDQSKKYMCSECSEEFDIKFSYQRHMETHSVDRPKFGCHICLKLYTTKFNRDRHIKLHK
ncbi:hypothetical protein CLU79DRAFT_718787 [Phycomyces nitens]|nr:hypothetical protein CLU79DRAFT_718787 [Phycomyces nitens]